MAGFSVLDILNKNSKTEERPQEERPRFIRGEVDIDQIRPSKDNFYSTDEIEELKASIEMFGILQELLVKEVENGNVEIIAGHRRYWADKALVEEGKKQFRKLPCRIEISLETVKEKLMFLMTNSTIRVLKDWEKVQQAAELKKWLKEYAKYNELPGRMRNYIAEILHISPTQAGRLDKIDRRLSDEYKQALKNGEIGLSTAEELSRLSAEEQREIFEQTGGKTKLNDVQQYRENKPWTEMTPCELCRSANPDCGDNHCCKACEDTCNGQQICRIDESPEKWQAAKENGELAEQKQQQVPRFTALEREQAKIDEWNRNAQEQRQASIESEESAEQEAEPACLIIEGDARPKSRKEAQPEKRAEEVVEPGLLKIEAARFAMGVLEREIEKCGIEIRYAEEQGRAAKGALAAAKLEYLGGMLSKVQADLFDMTGDDIFREEW